MQLLSHFSCSLQHVCMFFSSSSFFLFPSAAVFSKCCALLAGAAIGRCRPLSHRRKNFLRGLFGSVSWLFMLSAALCHNGLTPAQRPPQVPAGPRRLLAGSIVVGLCTSVARQRLGPPPHPAESRSRTAEAREGFFLFVSVRVHACNKSYTHPLTWRSGWELL